MEPYSSSQHQPFLDLLNSQGTQQFPLPLFSSQLNLSQLNFSQESHQTQTIPNLPEKRRKWSSNDDIVLCSAWLNTSKDAIVSNEQKNSSFWNRVATYFNASLKLTGKDCREGSTCKNRWAKINEADSKFVGAYDTASRNKTSGMNEDNIMMNALKIYEQDQKCKFTLEHCWLELRNDQKWLAMASATSEGSAKRKKMGDEEVSSKPLAGGEGNERPIGVKAAKGKTKKKRTEYLDSDASQTALETYEKMISMKEKDVALKKEIAKTNMLDSLLAKTTPLSDLETKLKEKLISEMLNE